jgi:acetolactate synthase-1/2/3 large subunit
VALDAVDREAFQEVDFRRMFGQLAKWVAQIDRAERVPEYLSHAFHTATAGRPGPVVLALPEDMLTERADVADVPRYRAVQAHPGAHDMAALAARLQRAQRPLVLVGGGSWSARASDDLRAWAEAARLPVGASFRCQDYLDNRSPSYVGDVGLGVSPKLAARVRDADLLLVLGARLGEATTSGYTLVEPPVPRQQLVHVHADPEELGRVYAPSLAVCAGGEAFCTAARALPALDSSTWAEWTASARAEYEAWQVPTPQPGGVNLGEVVAWLAERLPDDAIVTNGAGNYTVWLHRFYRYRRFRTQLAPTSGAMGYGLPAAVAAKAVHPDRIVVALAGDGCFLMAASELATAVQHELPIVVVVADNRMYGTIRMHQERHYPGRVSGSDLENPDFAALARAYGAHGVEVHRTEDFADAFEEALAAGRPALLSLRVDPEALTPAATLSATRERALQAAR